MPIPVRSGIVFMAAARWCHCVGARDRDREPCAAVVIPDVDPHPVFDLALNTVPHVWSESVLDSAGRADRGGGRRYRLWGWPANKQPRRRRRGWSV